MSGKESDEVTERLLHDPKFLKSVRDLCPKKGDGIESITISIPRTGDSVTLTPDMREKINRRLRARKAAELTKAVKEGKQA